MRRIVTVLATLALVACGTNTANPEGTQPTPSTTLLPVATTTMPATTTTIAPVETSTAPQASSTTTTRVIPATTTTQDSTRETEETVLVAPYFYIDEAGRPERSGPFVLPVARQVPATAAVARAALEQLFAGPTHAEQQGVPPISTAIPDGVRLIGLTVTDSIATVDLSAEFGASDGSAIVAQRAAQVVFTLSRFDSISEVLFHQEGKPVAIQVGDGNLVSRPVGIWDYLEFAAAITVESPAYRGQAENPLRVTGFAAVFEGAFKYALTDNGGLIIAEGFAMTNNGTGWGGFDFTVPYEVSDRQMGSLIVWADSAKDGSRVDVREYQVVLVP